MLKVLVIFALIYGVQLTEDSEMSTQRRMSVGQGVPSDIDSENLAVIMDKRRKLEVVRLAEVLTLRAIKNTKAKSEELTKIIDKRLYHIKTIFRRLPSIVAYLTKKYPDMDVGLTQMSYMYLTTLVGSEEPPIKTLSWFFQKVFKNEVGEGKHVEIMQTTRNASEKMRHLVQAIGQNYLASTMVCITESVSFMEKELNKTETMLSRLPEIVNIVTRAPYDYISEDRVEEGYKQLIKRD